MKIEGNVEILQLICKFRDRISILSLGKCVSSSGFHLSAAGLLGVCGVIFAAREGIFGNSDIFPRRENDGDLEKWVVPGLRNLGNNCFLNVILQALSSCSCLRKFLDITMEECERLLGEEWVETLPLTAALASLMEDLGNAHHKRLVLDPGKLMNVMDRYASNFNLATQQDAEEAFFHVLSSLRDEVSSISVPVSSSLANVTIIDNRRILLPKRNSEQTDQERWENHFLGPFNGIVSSSLTCESCSFQISLDFQFFHSLHVSPVQCGGGADVIMPGCSLGDCLKQYFVAEQLENYCCKNCWHLAALKYLTVTDGNEANIEMLRNCCEEDSCECKHLASLKSMRWSNSFSRTYKQLNIARAPKILCIHLQRVMVNSFGEIVKLQGHISFPLNLRLNPFMKNYTGAKNLEETPQTLEVSQQLRNHPRHSQFRTSTLDGIYGQYGQAFRESNISKTRDCSDNDCGDLSMQSDDKAEESCQLAAQSKTDDQYQLVSVVEHFGRPTGGHYTVYRRALLKNDENSNMIRWFCISDSQVHGISEEEVLSAEATLLFYEKVSENNDSC